MTSLFPQLYELIEIYQDIYVWSGTPHIYQQSSVQFRKNFLRILLR